MSDTRLLYRRVLALVIGMAVGLTALVLPAQAAGSSGPGQDAKPSAAELAVPGTVDGTVSTPDGGAVEGDVSLYRWDPAGEYFDYVDGQYVDGASPAPYSFTVEPGFYYVDFYDYTGSYADTAFGGGATRAPASLDDPGVVEVSASEGATLDVDLAALALVSGSVQDDAGQPLADVEVEAYTVADGDEWYEDGTWTDGNGDFSLSLSDGSYRLRFLETEDHLGTSVDVTVSGGDVVVPTVTMPSVGRADLTGMALGADGQPVADTYVTLYRLYDYDDDEVYDEWDYTSEVAAGPDGSFTLAGVPQGRPYTIAASAPGHERTMLGGGDSVLDGTVVTPTGNQAVGTITMARASTVGGTVSGPAGPASGVEVALYQWDPDDETFYDVDYATTDEQGRYDLSGLGTGHYTLYFDASFADDALASAWLGGGATMPSSETAAGVFQVTSEGQTVTRDQSLARAQAATGTVTDEAGTALAEASVVSYVWEDFGDGSGSWEQYAETLTREDGTFAVRVPASSTVTFRFGRGGFEPEFLGGGSSLPATPGAGNSRSTGATGDVSLGAVALAPFQSALGKVAGQDLAYCRTHVLPANDDDSTEAVPLPFDLTFFGTPYEEIYVNNNGNVTFDSALGDYTPEDITGDTGRPIIAPFFADVDTSSPESNVVTYGSSPDGNVFCVNWADVGYYSGHADKLNTVQLLLTKNTAGAGRVAGDFDVTFNYDEILWETGDASDGTDGFGGESALAGFSAGTGAPGTFVQLPGSLVNGALLDGGPNSLVAGSQNSTTDGRYVFQVRNDGLSSSLGGITGSVVRDAGGAGLAATHVEACRVSGGTCSYTETDGSGNFQFSALLAGNYQLRVWPADDSLFGGGAEVTVPAGETVDLAPIRLAAPVPMPSNVQLTNNGVGDDGVPSVFYGDPLSLQVVGCPGVSQPTYSVTLSTGEVIRDRLPMTEGPSGTYRATIAPLAPHTGSAEISTNVPGTCGAAPVGFNVYIDPSGIVTDQYGRPLAGAEVTLLRADTPDGTYEEVPDGSDVMSPSNRANPSFTDNTGYFRWDVQTGWYKVRAEHASCTPTTTDGMEVPPERIDLVIKLTCTTAAPTPAAMPAVQGTPKVGQTITARDATWAGPLESASVQLLRNGTPLSGTSHTLSPADIGVVFSVRATGRRPDYVTEAGSGATVSFLPVVSTSAGVTGLIGDAPTAPAPALTGTAQPGQTLTVAAPAWNVQGVTTAYQWLRDGVAIPGATAATYRLTSEDVGRQLRVRAVGTRQGYADGQTTSAAVTAGKATSTTKATPAKKKVKLGKKVLLTVKVTSALAPVTGKVKIFDKRKVLKTLTLTAASAGVVKVGLKKLRKGKHVLKAVYLGNASIAGSKSRKAVVKVVK